MSKIDVKTALAELKSNQSELAGDCCISKQAISQYLKGRTTPTDINKMKIEIQLNFYRNSEIQQLQRRIQYLSELEWDI